MEKHSLSKKEYNLIDELVSFYISQRNIFEIFLNNLSTIILNNPKLKNNIHSFKWRTKSEVSLKDKLERKFITLKKENKKINISKYNLFLKINDLAGFRILHLHSTQFPEINKNLKSIFAEENYKIIEGPKARVWDDESRNYFNSIGIKTENSGDSLYTSVHYIINPQKQTKFTVEIQVRTLAEEIWGEVDHSINYPHETTIISCKEQIKVLARLISSCTRLVDSIFLTHNLQKSRQNIIDGSNNLE